MGHTPHDALLLGIAVVSVVGITVSYIALAKARRLEASARRPLMTLLGVEIVLVAAMLPNLFSHHLFNADVPGARLVRELGYGVSGTLMMAHPWLLLWSFAGVVPLLRKPFVKWPLMVVAAATVLFAGMWLLATRVPWIWQGVPPDPWMPTVPYDLGVGTPLWLIPLLALGFRRRLGAPLLRDGLLASLFVVLAFNLWPGSWWNSWSGNPVFFLMAIYWIHAAEYLLPRRAPAPTPTPA
jgi:hypothetical protein